MWQSFGIETCAWLIPARLTRLRMLRVGRESSAAFRGVEAVGICHFLLPREALLGVQNLICPLHLWRPRALVAREVFPAVCPLFALTHRLLSGAAAGVVGFGAGSSVYNVLPVLHTLA